MYNTLIFLCVPSIQAIPFTVDSKGSKQSRSEQRRSEQSRSGTGDSERQMDRLDPSTNSHDISSECPLSRDQLGRRAWAVLHTMAAYYPERPTAGQQRHMTQMLDHFSEFFPCQICSVDFRAKYSIKTPFSHHFSYINLYLLLHLYLD